MKTLKIQMNGRSDEFGTPKECFEILKPFLKKKTVIWECAWGKGSLAKHIENGGFVVVGENRDFLSGDELDCSYIITNPPYSLKEEFLKRAYEIGKPFAFLMPLTALEGKKRGELYKKYGIQLIIPNKRFNFETPSGKGSGSWFATAWFCYGLNLPKDLNFIDLQALTNQSPNKSDGGTIATRKFSCPSIPNRFRLARTLFNQTKESKNENKTN